MLDYFNKVFCNIKLLALMMYACSKMLRETTIVSIFLIGICVLIKTCKGNTPKLSCTSLVQPILGRIFIMRCKITGKATNVWGIYLNKDGNMLMSVPRFQENERIHIYAHRSAHEIRARVEVVSQEERRVDVIFNELEWSDNGVYDWSFHINTNYTFALAHQSVIEIKIPAIMMDSAPVANTPIVNLTEGDTITFTCKADLGRNPTGMVSWSYFITGSTDGIDVTHMSCARSLLGPYIYGENCSHPQLSELTLKLSREMHLFVVQCTVKQGDQLNNTDTALKTTQPIPLFYPPKISELQYPEYHPHSVGQEFLMLSCPVDVNPPASYAWMHQHDDVTSTQVATGPQLIISNLTIDDSGIYTCVAYNCINGRNWTVFASSVVNIVEAQNKSDTSVLISTTHEYPGTKDMEVQNNNDTSVLISTTHKYTTTTDTTKLLVGWNVAIAICVAIITCAVVLLLLKRRPCLWKKSCERDTNADQQRLSDGNVYTLLDTTQTSEHPYSPVIYGDARLQDEEQTTF